MLKSMLFALIFAVIFGCGHRVRLMVPVVSADSTYVYYRDGARWLVVTHRADFAEKAALELGCKPCAIVPIGELFVLEQVK